MPFSVCRAVDWHHEPDHVISRLVAFCPDLRPVPKLLLISMIALGSEEFPNSAEFDRLVGVHRNSRLTGMRELRDLGLIRAISAARVELQPLTRGAKFLRFGFEGSQGTSAPLLTSGRNPKQELADTWNELRPVGYARIRVVSDSLAKSVNAHISDLGLKAYDYETFFRAIAAGVESSDFWSNENSNKTLMAITGVNRPSDRKRANVFALFERGSSSPERVSQVAEQPKSTVYPASMREVIDEYVSAQFAFAQAFDLGGVRPGHSARVRAAQQAILDKGFDPQALRRRFPQVPDKCWPGGTRNPEKDPLPPAFDDDKKRAAI
jgi:hypothetical protein